MMAKKRWLAGLGLLAVLLAGILAYPFVAGDMETLALDDAARATIKDRSFVRLTDGYTCYQMAGPEDGQPVVLVHGMTGPSFIWDHQFDALAQAGFRVLRYDLYGRGYSDRPACRYDENLFDRQLLELLDALGITRPADIVGLSMGGAVTVRFLDRHPERVRRFALFAPSGFPVHVPLKYAAMHWPGVGEWMMKAVGDRYLASGVARRMRLTPEQKQVFEALYVDQMRYRGHKRALLSTLRHTPLLTLESVYENAGKKGRKGMLFWGTADHVIPFEHHKLVQTAMPDLEFHALEGWGHTVNYENPEAVNAPLIAFLKQAE
jgi:pimeloyl-ACP methyl ester carboxylesterase